MAVTQSLSLEGPVLVLCPHPDDEIGCGGLVSAMIERRYEIHYRYFSDCAESTRSLGYEPRQLIEECIASCTGLGIPQQNVSGYDFPVRHFPAHRQEILEILVKLRAELKPGIVLTTMTNDIHQDHSTVTSEAIRAFKHTTVLGYELPWNQLKSEIDLLFGIERRHLDAKLRSWDCYKTQKKRDYSGSEVFEALARLRGMQAKVELAEAYQVIRIVM